MDYDLKDPAPGIVPGEATPYAFLPTILMGVFVIIFGGIHLLGMVGSFVISLF